MTDRRAEIEAAHLRSVELGIKIKELQPQYEEAMQLEREARGLETEIKGEEVRLDRERYRLQCDVETLEGEAKELSRFDGEVARIEKQISDIGDAESRRLHAEEQRTGADERIVALKSEFGSLKAQIEALQKRRDALAESDSSLCDYCGQPLPPGKRAAAITETEAEQARLVAKQEKVTASGRDAKRQSDQFRSEDRKGAGRPSDIARLEAQRAQAAQEQLRLTERTKTLPDLKRRLDRFAQQLAERDFAHARAGAPDESLRAPGEAGACRTAARRCPHRAGHPPRLREEPASAPAGDRSSGTEPARVQELTNQIAKREGQIEKAQKQIGDIRVRTAALHTLRREQADVSSPAYPGPDHRPDRSARDRTLHRQAGELCQAEGRARPLDRGASCRRQRERTSTRS
jgi:hypothetical protein